MHINHIAPALPVIAFVVTHTNILFPVHQSEFTLHKDKKHKKIIGESAHSYLKNLMKQRYRIVIKIFLKGQVRKKDR